MSNEEAGAYNIALNKKGDKCNELQDLDSRLLDGYFEETVTVTKFCEQPIITIFFGDAYIISHQVLYAGEGWPFTLSLSL